MPGLFDGFQFDPQSYGGVSGLLGMLTAGGPNPALANSQPSPLDNAQWPAGPVGAPPSVPDYGQTRNIQIGSGPNAYMMPQFGNPPAQDPAALPPNAQPVSGQMPQAQPMQAPQPQEPGFGDRLTAGLRGFSNGIQEGGLLSAVLGGVGGLSSGQAPTGPTGVKAKAAYDALIAGGVPAPQAFAAIKSGNQEILKYTMDKYGKNDKFRPATPQERQAAGISDGNTPMFINQTTGEPKFGPAQTNVNVSTEKTGQAELATKGVNSYVEAQNAGRDAQRRIGMYDTFEKAAQGFVPGATAEMRLTAKRYLKDAGLIKGEDVPDGEVMQMISRQLGTHAQPKGQGAVSNYERELFAKSLPNMTQSPEGLRQAIGISRKLEQFDQRVAGIYRESARANKGLPNYLDVQDKIAALGSPLSDNEMATISGAGNAPAPGAQPAQPAPQGPPKSGNYTWVPGKGLVPR